MPEAGVRKREFVWVRVSRNGSQLVLGKAHSRPTCQYLQAQYSLNAEPRIVPLSGPILKDLKRCELCYSPEEYERKRHLWQNGSTQTHA